MAAAAFMLADGAAALFLVAEGDAALLEALLELELLALDDEAAEEAAELVGLGAGVVLVAVTTAEEVVTETETEVTVLAALLLLLTVGGASVPLTLIGPGPVGTRGSEETPLSKKKKPIRIACFFASLRRKRAGYLVKTYVAAEELPWAFAAAAKRAARKIL